MTTKIRIEYVALAGVKPAKRNPKGHDDDLLDESLDRFGYVEPVLMDERTGRLVAGHGRLGRLKAREKSGAAAPAGIVAGRDGWKLPVVRGWSSADDAEAEAYLIASNRLVEAGGWADGETLAAMLQSIAGSDAALSGVGYTPEQLGDLLAGLGPAPSLDDLADQYPEPSAEDFWPVVRVRVDPEAYELWKAQVAAAGDDEVAAFAQLLAGAPVT